MKLEKAQNGEWTLGVQEESSLFRVHSKIDPSAEGRLWAEQFEMENRTAYFVLGCGLGYHILALQKNIPPDSKIIVAVSEVEMQLLLSLKEKVPAHLFSQDIILLLRSMQEHNMAVISHQFMLKHQIKKLKVCPYRPAMRLAQNFYDSCQESIVKRIEQTMSGTFNVLFWTGALFTKNFCKNIVHIVENPGIQKVSKLFSQETPVVVVGAGPSLDKNIQVLKEMRSDVVIIAAGSAMAALKRAEIVPHFLFIVDAWSAMFDAVKDSVNSQTVLIANYVTNEQVIDVYPGKKIFVLSNDVPPLTALRKYLPKTENLSHAISVSTLAVDFAQACGSTKVILVGQDLSFPYGNKQQHALGVETAAYEGESLMIEGYEGGLVSTDASLKLVIDFFNAYVQTHPHVDFINATEGGAKIQAMRQASLRSVAESEGVLGKSWGEKTDRKIQELIFSYKPRKLGLICKELFELENSVAVFGENMKNLVSLVATMELKSQYEAYKERFTNLKNSKAMEILEHVVTPRMQAVAFYEQEKETTMQEIVSMYEGVAKNVECFCCEIVEYLKKVQMEIKEKTYRGK